jgi:formiminotetrahydrofolate cyclodeaminase
LNEFVQGQRIARGGAGQAVPSAAMTGLSDQPLARLLDVVASTDPAPGGGSSAAVAGALAAALLQMSAGLELAREAVGAAEGNGIPHDAPERARELRERALELADQDLSSYAPVLDALRMPAGHPERAQRLQAALAEASRAPVAIAEGAAETATLAARVTALSNPAVRGDALAGVLIAEAATVAAASLVEINLAGRDGDADLARVRDARRRAQEAREDALATLPRGSSA